jgi:tetratricopeptide (TPR) repeat protein
MELTIEQALQQGIAAHREGKIQDAERLYRAILQSQPLNPDANHNLGLIAVSVNKTEAALPLFKTALKASPKIEQFWLSYIDALIKDNQINNAKRVIKKAKKKGFSSVKLDALAAKFYPKTQVGNADTSSPSQYQLNSLLKYYQTGQSDDAEKLAKSITQQFPQHQFAWKVLGAIFGQSGRTIEAENANQTSVALSPQDAEAHYNLGITLKERGRLDEAEARYTTAIDLKPDSAEAHSNLGITLQVLGRLDESEASCRQAIALKPNSAEAHSNLGNTLQELGRLDESEASYTQAIVLKPDYVEAHSNLGNTLQELGKLDESEASYTQAIALKPDYAEAHSNLGGTLLKLGRLGEAEASYRQAIALKPDSAEAHSNLGGTLLKLGRLDEAEASCRQSIALKPDFAEAHNNLGGTLQELGRLDEAEASCRQAIALKPDFAEAHSNLGGTLQELGRLDEAEANYTQAIALKPDFAEAHRILTSMKIFDAQDEQYSKMQELYLDKNISEEQRCHINFGLAKACEDLGDFEQAFAHYSEGNLLRKKLLNYDINQDVELFKQIKFNYPRIEKNSLESDKLSKNLMPIFIVGMPRSGTTLVEQIISSHLQVTGAGELSFATQFGALIARGLSDANNESLLNFRGEYLKKLQNVSNGSFIVTDKMPQNFLYIGLLAAVFPEAKIVHVKRKHAAVCWANYKQYFTSKSIGYCYELCDILTYHKLYENLMEFWGKRLSNRIYNIDYELLTVNQESETRQLIEYLGLVWDENCLLPQNNMRSVATASNLQVRQKVYQGSSEQWKKYELYLNGAFDYLDD